MSDVQSSLEATGSKHLGTDCLSFLQIPHSTRLFTDFLYDFEKVSNFYPRAPHSPERLTAPQIPADRIQQVAAVLDRQNRNFGAGAAALKNIERLGNGAPVVITGHQVGLLGGPISSLLNELTLVLLAAQYGAGPIFWLATQDHDLEAAT